MLLLRVPTSWRLLNDRIGELILLETEARDERGVGVVVYLYLDSLSWSCCVVREREGEVVKSNWKMRQEERCCLKKEE